MDEGKVKILTEFQVPELHFSKKNLRSVIFNLLSNAVKYRSPDRNLELTVKTEKRDEDVVFSIQDNGLGLDKTSIKRYFFKVLPQTLSCRRQWYQLIFGRENYHQRRREDGGRKRVRKGFDFQNIF